MSMVVALGVSSPAAAATTYEYTFEFVNGITLTGSSEDKTAFIAGAGGSSVENPTGMEVHLSCSDDFEGGWGQKDGPEQSVDTAWQLSSYSIQKFKDGKLDKTCGADFGPPTPVGVPAIDIEKFVNGVDADDPTGPVVNVGDTVTFTYVVTNTGEVPLENVAAVDLTLGPLTCPSTSLDVGESMDCDPNTEVVTSPGQMFMEAEVTATGETGAPGVTDPIPGNGKGRLYSFTFVNGITLSGDAPDDNTFFLAGAGGPSVDNPTGMEVHLSCSDEFEGGWGEKDGPEIGVDTAWQLAAFEIIKYKDGKEDKRCGNSFFPVTQQVFDSDPVYFLAEEPADPAIDIEKSVNGEDADDPPGPTVPLGSTVTFGYVVTNTGDVPLTDVSVVDSTLGPVTCPQTTLAVGETIECGPNTEVAEMLGAMFMKATVTGNGGGTPVMDMDPVNFVVVPAPNPAIDIEKFVNGFDADDPPGPTLSVGDTATFTYVVTNTGNVPLTDVSVVDSTLGPVTCPQTTLAVGETMECDPHSEVVTRPGPVFMKATVIGFGADTLVMDMAPVNFVVIPVDPPDPAVDIEKFVNGIDADDPPGPTFRVGDTVTFTYVVTNTGDVPLSDLSVVDSTLGPIACPRTELDVGESMECDPHSEVLTETGSVFMKATVTGNGGGTPVMDMDPVNFKVIKEREDPKVDIEKYVNGHDSDYGPGVQVWVGDELTFTYEVTNTGNTVLTNIVVVDDTLGVRECPKTTLDPGESMSCTPATIVAEHPGQVFMYSDVYGWSPRGVYVDDRDPVKFFVNGTIY